MVESWYRHHVRDNHLNIVSSACCVLTVKCVVSCLELFSSFLVFFSRSYVPCETPVDEMASPFQVLMNDTMSYDSARHPYYPLDVSIVGYLANESTVLSLLGSFVAGCATIFGSTYLAVKRMNSGLPATELITVMWFVLCGCIHLFFEGERTVLSVRQKNRS
jgi:zinc transporter ZupT